MKRIATGRTKAFAIFAVLAAMALRPGTTQGQSHETLIYATLAGPNEDSFFPRAHVGDTVNVHVMVENRDTFWDSITINTVSLVIHHGNGNVILPNLTPDAVVLPLFRASADFPTSFVVGPDDGDVLLVDFEVQGTDNWDGATPGIPLAFSTAGGVQMRILKPAVEVFQRCDVSPAHPFGISSGYVTNTGNTLLNDVVVVSDNGTPENSGDDTTISIESLPPHTSAPYVGIYAAMESPSRNTVTVRATDVLGLMVSHSITRAFPETASPVLRIARASGTTIQVSWPESADGFRLVSSDDLGPGRNWTAITNTPVASAGEYSVILDLSGAARFFQLVR